MLKNKGKKQYDSIIQIASGLFLTKGYEHTSVDDIITDAGIAKGTFYYYFRKSPWQPSKDFLLF